MTERDPKIMTLRLDPDVRACLQILAAVDRRSMTNLVNVLLWEAVGVRASQPDAPPKLSDIVQQHYDELRGTEE